MSAVVYAPPGRRASRSSMLGWRIFPDDPSQIEPAMVVEWVAQHLCHRAEVVFIGGNGFQAARAIHHLERRTGRPVLEANQVLLWSVLESAGAPVAVRGFRDVVRRPAT